MLIFITGYMGSGKTFLGKQLAVALKYRFLDLDELIEAETGLSVGEIFKLWGEDKFREAERSVLMKNLEENDVVIATGGGTPCYSDNMELMNSRGLTVFLDLPEAKLSERLLKEKDTRPLLTGADEEVFEVFVKGHLASRKPFYLKSRLIVQDDDIGFLADLIRTRFLSETT